MTKSLRKYFGNLKVTDNDYGNDYTALNETITYFKNNGFVCYKVKVPYINNSGWSKKGVLHVAEQKTTGKTITFEVDKFVTRDRSMQKLNSYDSDYKVILLKESNKHYFTEDGIEVISVKNKTKEEIMQDREQARKIAQQKKISSISGLEKDEERKLFDLAYEHMKHVFNEYGTLIPYGWLFNKMKENHSVLIDVLGKRANTVIKQVISEWKEIQKTQRGVF